MSFVLYKQGHSLSVVGMRFIINVRVGVDANDFLPVNSLFYLKSFKHLKKYFTFAIIINSENRTKINKIYESCFYCDAVFLVGVSICCSGT